VEVKKVAIRFIIIYFAIGFTFGMIGEFRLAKKYGGKPYEALIDPYAYLRSVVSAPFWPYNLYWTIYHCQSIFGCEMEGLKTGLWKEK